ncbi:hypothetical protein B0I37DRAFT_356080 [Chaetomium sp. MPI-CAGE-AT-0009]|nr:hypothetical protein B0I37DRAFT_356080 [Chaetomium sp. MPI-CAGE-AT-0009]
MDHRAAPTTVVGPLVLLTGANGQVGSSILKYLLQEGYRVRAAVRSHSKACDLYRRPTIQATKLGPNLSFAVVPSITGDGAYDRAMEGVTYVIHCASPVATGAKVVYANDDGMFFIRPAVKGTLNVLKAAAKTPTVARVVVTSSLAALVPFQDLSHRGSPRAGAHAYTPLDRAPLEPGPYRSDVEAYVASKVSALRAAEEWVATNAPRHFDVVHLHPGFVLGPNHAAGSLQRAQQGANMLVTSVLAGRSLGAHAAASVHVDDLARAHVRALDSAAVPGARGYVISQPAAWEDIPSIAHARFPYLFRVNPGPVANVSTARLNLDDAATREAFPGVQFAPFEDQVESVIQQYLDLADEADLKALRAMARRIRRRYGATVAG